MKACVKCGVAKPLDEFYLPVSGYRRRDCKACCSAYAKQRPAYPYEPNAEKACSRCLVVKKNTEFARNKNSKLGTRSWCKECFRAYAAVDNKARYHANRDLELARAFEWANANRERCAANRRAHRALNRRRECSRRMGRHHQMKELGGGVSAEQWAEILEVHDRRCAYCLKADLELQLDHVIALSRGGEHDANNVVPACAPCNGSKGGKAMFEIFNQRLLVAQRSA